MGEVTGERFCPLCEQIVPREVEGVFIRISPARSVLLHEGCAEMVSDSLNNKRLAKEKVKEEKGGEE